MKDLDFVPECFIDTNIVETLMRSTGVNHKGGCPAVCKFMLNHDGFAVGIMDHDKKIPSYVENQFNELVSSKHLILLKHNTRPQFVIHINPACEKFILECAEVSGIDLSEYNLPNNLDDLKLVTKDVDAQKDHVFKKLFKELNRRNAEFQCLSNVLHYLQSKRYKASNADLIRFFNAIV